MSRAMQFDIVANDKASVTMDKVDKSMEKFGKNFAGSLSMAYGKAQAVISVITSLMHTITELGNVSDDAARMGLSVEAYTKLKFAAEEYGASIEEIAKAMKDVNKMLDEAATKKSGNAFDTLKALGFSDKDIIERRIRQVEVFERLSEAIKGASSEEEKFAITSRVLGDKISQSMVPVLENYKEFNLAQAKAVTMSQAQADTLDKMGDKWAGFTQFLKSLGGAALAKAGNILMEKEPTLVAQPPTAEEIAKRDAMKKALLSVGGGEQKTAAKDVTSMAAIGGASFRGFSPVTLSKPIEEQQLTALEQIATNTSPQTQQTPSIGATDPTKGDPLADIVGRIYQSGSKNPNNYDRYKTMRPAR